MNVYNTNESMTEDHYANNLRHMAEPADPSDREEAVSTTLSDVQSLYLATILREWSAYHADEEQREIALGYTEFIEKQVRQNEKCQVTLYAHTAKAAETVNRALEDYIHFYEEQAYKGIYKDISECVIDLWGRHNAEEVNADAGKEMYAEAPDEIEVQGEE